MLLRGVRAQLFRGKTCSMRIQYPRILEALRWWVFSVSSSVSYILFSFTKAGYSSLKSLKLGVLEDSTNSPTIQSLLAFRKIQYFVLQESLLTSLILGLLQMAQVPTSARQSRPWLWMLNWTGAGTFNQMHGWALRLHDANEIPNCPSWTDFSRKLQCVCCTICVEELLTKKWREKWVPTFIPAPNLLKGGRVARRWAMGERGNAVLIEDFSMSIPCIWMRSVSRVHSLSLICS